MAEPLVVVIMEGGLIQEILASQPVRVRIIDWDARVDAEDHDPDRGERSVDLAFHTEADLEAEIQRMLREGW